MDDLCTIVGKGLHEWRDAFSRDLRPSRQMRRDVVLAPDINENQCRMRRRQIPMQLPPLETTLHHL
jgi:hypothetical protein